MKGGRAMSNEMIFGLILMAWATVGTAGAIFQDRFKKVNWCGILFLLLVPFIPFIAKFFGIS